MSPSQTVAAACSCIVSLQYMLRRIPEAIAQTSGLRSLTCATLRFMDGHWQVILMLWSPPLSKLHQVTIIDGTSKTSYKELVVRQDLW